MKSTKSLAAMSSILLVLSATIVTSAFAISDLRESVAGDGSRIIPVQPNRGSFQDLPGRSGAEVTDLILDPITQEVKNGNAVTLTGKLITTSGEGVVNARINIIDHSASSQSSSHDSSYDNTVIAIVVTDSEGFYEATWVPHNARAYTILTQFDGNQNFLSSVSDRIDVNVQ